MGNGGAAGSKSSKSSSSHAALREAAAGGRYTARARVSVSYSGPGAWFAGLVCRTKETACWQSGQGCIVSSVPQAKQPRPQILSVRGGWGAQTEAIRGI